MFIRGGRKMKYFKLRFLLCFSLILLMMSDFAFAECWIVSEFKGYGAAGYNNFEIQRDGISGQKFVININGKNSSVISSDIKFIEVTPYAIVGIKDGVIETWSINIEKRKAFYTKTASGYGPFDGVKMFVGNLEGKCKVD
jgi:hypothetical protein